MNNVMKVMIVLGMIMFLLGSMAGCKEKNEEEEIEDLVEKMGEAKTEQEAAKIAEKIEKLEQRAKKSSKEIIVKLGQPFTFWQHGQGPSDPQKMCEFRMTFKDPVIDEFRPWDPKFWELIRGHRTPAPRTPAEQGKKYFCIVANVENLGPRKASFERHMELKVDRGFIYRLVGNMVDDPEEDYPRTIYTLEPEKTGWLRLWCQIPEDTKPVEVSGRLGEGYFGAPGYTKFHLELTQEEREKEKRKLSKRETQLLGKYVAQMDDGSQISLELKGDGTASVGGSQMAWEVIWEPRGNPPYSPTLTLMFYTLTGDSAGIVYHAGDGKKAIKISDGFNFFRIDFWHRRGPSGDEILGKQEGAELIKLGRVKVWDIDERVICPGEVDIWNRYVDKAKDQERVLEVKRIANFSPPGWKRLTGCDGSCSFCSIVEWQSSKDKIKLNPGGETRGEFEIELEIKGNTLIDKRNGITFMKQTGPFPLPTSLPTPDKPESTPQSPPSATPGLEEKEKLVQQIDVRVKVYSDKNVFTSPPISLTLRVTAPHLVEKVETIYFSALDYQFLSLRSLRYAKYFLDKGDMPKANKYIEKADRYYRLATSLQRDSLAVLQSTISAAEWIVVYKASRTALGFTATGLGIESSILFDIGTLYTDYLLDTSTTSVEEAKKNLIAKAISNVLLRFTGASDFVGDAVKHGWGSSRAFPVLQKIMGSSEFKDEVLKEFMRLGGDIGDYVAKETIEEVLARIIKGGIEEEPEKKEVEAEESLPLATREEFPETLPKVSLEPSPEGAKLIAEAEQDLTAQPKRTISARDKLNKVLTMPLSNEQQSFVKKRLSELSSEWLFSEEVFAGDALSTKYQVKPRESISSIARTNKVPYEILMEVNRIKHPRSVQAGKEIKLIHGPFHAIVYRSTFTMDLYLQKTFVRSFRVGLGQLGRETPTGLWRVKRDGKLIKPPSADPESGKLLRYGDPGYALGSRWIGLEGIKGAAKNRTGFGIHGTEELETIGAESSRGCIRLHDSDVIFVYNLLVPVHSLVKVVE